jgi:hypothetical protein
MPRHEYVVLDPLFSDPTDAARIVKVCERFGRYSMYSQEQAHQSNLRGLPRSVEEVLHQPHAGLETAEAAEVRSARTDYFREEYALEGRPLVDGIDSFLCHDSFIEASRRIHGRPVIQPAMVVANLMIPGQEVALHTDVPEFRGMNRKTHPPWLLAAMRHSDLFEAWRLPMATGIAWFQDCAGGGLRFYPDGNEEPPMLRDVASNSALLFDSDTVFHGVDRLEAPGGEIPPIKAGMQLAFDSGGRWSVRGGAHPDDVVAGYRWEELRLSVSWKAYCFKDETELELWRSHADDLDLDAALSQLVADLRSRGRIAGDEPGPTELARLIVDEYIRF